MEPDAERSITLLHDGTVLSFGRGADNDLRFGHAPLLDREVPRRCGWICVVNGRVVVEAADARDPSDRTAGECFRPLGVTARAGRPMPVLPGEVYSPADGIFSVQVRGQQLWELDVVNFRDVGPRRTSYADPPTVKPRVALSDELWEILRAYAEPVQRGGRLPATHEEVARRVNWNKMTARRRLEKIHDEFYLQRLDMPDVVDTRVKVVEAALHHGLLPLLTDA